MELNGLLSIDTDARISTPAVEIVKPEVIFL